jgi:lysine 2,3-aminomutase
VLAFRRRHFPSVSWREWNDWHWQASHRIHNAEQLQNYLDPVSEEREALSGTTMLPFAITPYYLALIDATDPTQPLRRTVVPNVREFVRTAGESDDPLAEETHAVVPGLIHRYPDRVLFLATDHCTTYCRYCTRSRVVGSNELTAKLDRWQVALDYIRCHASIRDVLISGGDPLSLSDDKLDWLLGELRKIRHVEFVRLGTKMPAVLPQRITRSLVKMLKKHHPLWMSLHFIHPDECTPEAHAACARLADAGIPLGSQTVLLKGVNDDVETMRTLLHRMLVMRVRPYYLYQCDPISGSQHFRTPVADGVALMEKLRGHTTGYALPTYVIDAPGGGGKIPLSPNYLLGTDQDDLLLRNFEGRAFRYPDHPATAPTPTDRSQSVPTRRHLHTVV